MKVYLPLCKYEAQTSREPSLLKEDGRPDNSIAAPFLAALDGRESVPWEERTPVSGAESLELFM